MEPSPRITTLFKICFFLFISIGGNAQNLKMKFASDSLAFIDYESDKKWITKIESYKLSPSEKVKERINVKENFEYVNTISDLTINYNDVINSYISKYSSYQWLPKIYGLLNFYEPLFVSKLRQYGLPEDLKYLAIVESNLNPQAGSWAGASGLWQFMPATGREYGLAKNSKVNLFYDPYLSTDAACRYLVFLYRIFKDWNLVLSAYNSGQGRVLNAMKAAGSRNYWVVRNYLPAETRAYAPSFHAVRYIGKAYALYYNSMPRMVYNYSNVREFQTTEETTFRLLAIRRKLDLEKLYFLNPHIVTEIIPRNTFVYYIP